MKEQDVVTLEDGKEYLLLDELDYGHKKYFYPVKNPQQCAKWALIMDEVSQKFEE